MLIPVLLAGGSGNRLWPVSQANLPKSLQPLLGDEYSLLQQTARRAIEICPAHQIITVTAAAYADETLRQLTAIHPTLTTHVIAEPEGRDTAAATLTASLHALEHMGNVPLWITPIDHVITHDEGMAEQLTSAALHAQNGHIVTFGITPTAPDSRFGYIRFAPSPADQSNVSPVIGFHEKPEAYEAEQLIAAGNCLWNSGMFVFTPHTMTDAAATHAPNLLQACKTAYSTLARTGSIHLLKCASYAQIPRMPIDKAIMEHSDRLLVMPAAFEWADIGSWDSIWQASNKDDHGNATRGNVVMRSSRNSLVHAYSKKTICIGADDLIIVETPDALLITRKQHENELKSTLLEMAE